MKTMEENTSRSNWPDLIKKIPGWIMGLIAFVSAVVGFIKLWQGDTSLVTTVLLLVGVGGGWLGCAYLAFKRTPPLVEGGKGTWKYPRWRTLALAGLIAIPLLTAAALGAWWHTETHRSDQLVVLVADFYQEGTKEDPYGLSGVILGRLRDALAEERMTSVRALQQPITAQQGGDRAREIGRQHLYVLTLGDMAIGQKRQTAIVIWGWYARTEEKAWVDARFEVVRPPGGFPEVRLNGQVATLAELEHFDFQVRLSREMAFLTTFTVGLMHFEGEAYEAATVSFSQALAQTGELVEAVGQGEIYLYRGIAYLIEGEPVQAIADYGKAIELRPDRAETYVNRGVAYYREGEYDEAIADYDRAIELKPDLAEAYNNRGAAYAAKGENDQAIADYDRAIELKPDLAEAYNNRGAAYAAKGENDQAIADYGKAIELKPDYAGAYNNRGNAYADKGEYDEAIADYRKAIELRPDHAETYYSRGLAHANKGENDQAIADYGKAIELRPDYAEAYVNRGNTYANKGENDQAIANYDRAIELKPDDALAYYNRGLAHAHKGEYHLAIADYCKAIELRPDYTEAYVNRGVAYYFKGEYYLAIVGYSKAIELNPDLAEAYANRGVVYAHKDEYGLAIADFDRAIELKPDYAEVYSNRGLAHKMRGEKEKAIRDFEQVLELSEDEDLRKKAKEQLKELRGQ